MLSGSSPVGEASLEASLEDSNDDSLASVSLSFTSLTEEVTVVWLVSLWLVSAGGVVATSVGWGLSGGERISIERGLTPGTFWVTAADAKLVRTNAEKIMYMLK